MRDSLSLLRLITLAIAALATAALATRPAAAGEWIEPLTPFLREHCVACHSGDGAKGALDLEKPSEDLGDAEVLRRWVRVHDRIASGEMPPKGEPRPDRAAAQRFLGQLGQSLTKADAARRRTLLRRLNRIEYENTVRDLFDIRVDVKEMLPADPSAHGFDTVGDVLAISPEQMEVYLRAADKALDQVFGPDKEPRRVAAKLPMGRDSFASRSIGQLFVKTDDDSLVTFQGNWCPTVFRAGQATVDGTYRVKIRAKTYQTDKPLVMAVYGGDVIVGRLPTHLVGYYDIKAGDDWTEITFDDWLETYGCYRMVPYELNAPTQGPDRFKGAGLMLGEIEVEGPLEAWPPVSRGKLLGKVDPKSAKLDEAREIYARLLPRAFRRKTAADEVDLYVELTRKSLESGRPFVDALRVGLKAILCSPEFLLREEPVADSTEKPDDEQAPRISDHALACRLSYFLWSSMPDEELLRLADEGKLSGGEPGKNDSVLSQQVERMLRDPKADRFVKNFTGQWLKLREIDFTEPDARQYPEFDEMLRYSILEETHRYFREVLDKDLPLTDFIASDWTILNARLAKHYGIDGVESQEFRRVTLPADSPRGGVLTHASVLKVTANGTNTSPVVRGAWVLDNILGQPSPPPPPGIAAIEPDIRGATTIREQLDKHRNVESCAGCHRHIDPPGFALESFDAIGGQRTWYRSLGQGEPVRVEIARRRVQYKKGPNVDPSGTMPDGRKFADVREFKRLLLDDKDQLSRGLAEKLLTYGLGRGLGFSDRPAVEAITRNVAKKKYGFRALIHEVVASEVFRLK